MCDFGWTNFCGFGHCKQVKEMLQKFLIKQSCMKTFLTFIEIFWKIYISKGNFRQFLKQIFDNLYFLKEMLEYFYFFE